MSLLLLLGGVSYPVVEPFTGTSGVPHARWTVSTVGGATVELDTNRLKMVVPAPLDVGQALLDDVIPASGVVEYRASYTFTVGTNQTPAFSFRGDGVWQGSGNRHLFVNGLGLVLNTVANSVALFSTVASTATFLSGMSLTINATDTVNVHIITSGSAVYWTAWLSTDSEPAAWSTATDSNHTARRRLGLALQSPTAAPATTAFWDDVAVNDVPNATGTLAETLANVTAATAGASGSAGTLARTLSNATVNATGNSTGGGVLAETLDNAVVQAAGAHGVSGTLARTLGNVTVVASGAAADIAGSVARTLDSVEVNAPVTDENGSVITDESGNPLLVRGAEGFHGIGGVGTLTTANVTSTASGIASNNVGTLTETLDDVTSTTAGTFGVPGTLAETLADTTSTADGTVGATGDIAVTLANVTSAATGDHDPVIIAGNLAETLDALVAAAGGSSVAGEITRTLADLTSAADGTAGEAPITGTVAVTLANVTATSSAGVAGASGELARTLADLVSNSVGAGAAGTLAELLDDLTSSAVGAGAIIDFQAVTIRERFHVVSMREMN